jgi:hypothetical protein
MHGVLLMLIVPLEVLVHELAHAAAALRMTRGPVRVHVGQYPGLVRLRFGRLHVQLHFLPARGVNWSGICVHEPVLWPRQAAWIAALGPVASLLCALGCTVVLRLWGPGFDPSTRIIVALGAMTAVLDAVYNGRRGCCLQSPAIAPTPTARTCVGRCGDTASCAITSARSGDV